MPADRSAVVARWGSSITNAELNLNFLKQFQLPSDPVCSQPYSSHMIGRGFHRICRHKGNQRCGRVTSKGRLPSPCNLNTSEDLPQLIPELRLQSGPIAFRVPSKLFSNTRSGSKWRSSKTCIERKCSCGIAFRAMNEVSSTPVSSFLCNALIHSEMRSRLSGVTSRITSRIEVILG